MIRGGEEHTEWNNRHHNNHNHHNHNHPNNHHQEWNPSTSDGMHPLPQPQDEFYSPYATPHKHQPTHNISSSTEDDDNNHHSPQVFVQNDANDVDDVMGVEEVKPFHCVGVVWYAYTTDEGAHPPIHNTLTH